MGFLYDWHGDWHEHDKRKRQRQKLNDWHGDWHEHDKRKRHRQAHLIFNFLKHKKMILIANKVRITLKNELVFKQKRLLHSIAIFQITLEKFLELVELLPFSQITIFSSSLGSYVALEYTYQGNEYNYYLSDDETQNFLQIAKDKNIKYSTRYEPVC